LRFEHNINYFNIKVSTNIKDTVLTGQENNLPHHFITDKGWYIHVVVLHTQTDLRYGLVDKEKRNIHAFDFIC